MAAQTVAISVAHDIIHKVQLPDNVQHFVQLIVIVHLDLLNDCLSAYWRVNEDVK